MRLRSLQLRLAVRLGLVYIAAIAVAVSFFINQAYNTAGSLSERQLGLRAADLARYVFLDASGTPRLDLPPELALARKHLDAEYDRVQSQLARLRVRKDDAEIERLTNDLRDLRTRQEEITTRIRRESPRSRRAAGSFGFFCRAWSTWAILASTCGYAATSVSLCDRTAPS